MKRCLPAAQREIVLNRFEDCCLKCGCEVKIEMAHIQSAADGGDATVDNVIPLCRYCNQHLCPQVGLPS